MRNHNFVGAARREIQEGGFAVESSLLASAEWNPAILFQTKFGHLKLKINRKLMCQVLLNPVDYS
jgi:hypothetical protein